MAGSLLVLSLSHCDAGRHRDAASVANPAQARPRHFAPAASVCLESTWGLPRPGWSRAWCLLTRASQMMDSTHTNCYREHLMHLRCDTSAGPCRHNGVTLSAVTLLPPLLPPRRH